MKKKLIAMLLSAAMCLSLAACGQKADTPDTTDPAERRRRDLHRRHLPARAARGA